MRGEAAAYAGGHSLISGAMDKKILIKAAPHSRLPALVVVVELRAAERWLARVDPLAIDAGD